MVHATTTLKPVHNRSQERVSRPTSKPVVAVTPPFQMAVPNNFHQMSRYVPRSPTTRDSGTYARTCSLKRVARASRLVAGLECWASTYFSLVSNSRTRTGSSSSVPCPAKAFASVAFQECKPIQRHLHVVLQRHDVRHEIGIACCWSQDTS